MPWHTKRAGQSLQAVPRVTPDFDAMISIVSWNSVGFFFTEFVIPYAGVSLGGSGLGIGIMFSFIVLGSSMSALLVGYLADRARKTTLILVGAFGRGASYIVMFTGILVGSLAIMTAGTFILGLLVEFYWVPFDSLVSAKSCKDNRSYAFGRRHGAIGRGQLAGGIVGVTIFILSNELVEGSLSIILMFSPMLLFCACNMIGGLLFVRRVDEQLTYAGYVATMKGSNDCETPGEATTPLVEIAMTRTTSIIHRRTKLGAGFMLGFGLLLASYFLSAMNNMIAKPFLQIYMLRVIINNPTLVLLAYAPAGTMSMFLSPKIGALADRLNPYIGIAIISSFGAMTTLLIINVNNIVLFSALLVADTVLGNASSLILSNIFSRISIKNRGKILGAGSACNNLGGAIGPIIGGSLVDSQGIAVPFIASIFIELSLILPYVLALKRLRPFFAESLAEQKKKQPGTSSTT
jgi:MFS family permease